MDWLKTRKDTPACNDVIHFNNAGSSFMPDSVFDEMMRYLKKENSMGGYELMEEEAQKIEGIYQNIASLISSKANEIGLFENATRAWQAVVYGMSFQKGDVILTSPSEYVSNYVAFLHLKKTKGVEVVILKEDELGQTSLSDFKDKASKLKNIKLLSLCHIPSQNGLINPAKSFGEVAQENNIFYLLDATQSAGHLHLDVNELGCDSLVATGRKYMRGPRGTGFLYLKESKIGEIDYAMLDNKSALVKSENELEIIKDVRGHETWEKNFGLFIGLGSAAKYALNIGTKNIESRCLELGNLFREKLSSLNKVKVRDLGINPSGIVTFSVENKPSYDLVSSLRQRGINTTGVPLERARIDFGPKGIKDVVRASIHYFNTKEEIDQFIENLSSLIN